MAKTKAKKKAAAKKGGKAKPAPAAKRKTAAAKGGKVTAGKAKGGGQGPRRGG